MAAKRRLIGAIAACLLLVAAVGATAIAADKSDAPIITHAPDGRALGQAHGDPRWTFTVKLIPEAPSLPMACGLDYYKYRECRSPVVYRNLDPGHHVFRVKAREPDGGWSDVRSVGFTVGGSR